MEILRSRTGRKNIAENFCSIFKTMSKAVVDVEKGILAIDGELHSDQESELLAGGSKQEDLWGINIYPSRSREDFIEFTSLVNIRPHQANFSMEVENQAIREKIRTIVFELIDYES